MTTRSKNKTYLARDLPPNNLHIVKFDGNFLMEKEQFNECTRKEISRGVKDIKQGKNLSPSFLSAISAAK